MRRSRRQRAAGAQSAPAAQYHLPMPSPIRDFIQHHYRHFNAAALRAAADDYIKHIDGGNKMLLTMAGAMSTAELGISIAQMTRQRHLHAILRTPSTPPQQRS